MTKRLFIVLGLVLVSSLLLQCELILGSPENVNVGIDLSESLGNGASRGISSQYTVTEIHVSVFGPGMQPIEKIVSPNIPGRTVNLYVPAGEDRRFTVEVFIVPDAVHPHVVSYIGRATADLRPGRYTGLKIRMAAGATTLLVADYNGTNKLYEAADISFAGYQFGNLGGIALPSDLDIASDGRIVASNDTSFGIYIGNDRTGATSYFQAYANVSAIAIDRDANVNINRDALNILETNILYFAIGSTLYFSILADSDGPLATPSSPTQMVPTGLNSIQGMAVDPWNHRLYIVGMAGSNSVIMEYNPFAYANPGNPEYGQVIRTIGNPVGGNFQDIIEKNDGIFVLNNVPLTAKNVPIILKYDRDMNFLGGFGRVSSDALGRQFEPSANTGDFYYPKRFFAQENDGLYIIDDSDRSDGFNGDYDKLIFINTALDPASWRTFPATQSIGNPTGESFIFFDS